MKTPILFLGALLWVIFAVATETSFAQSLGDLARRERERKQNQPSRSSRVYTNEDLARPQILDPADRDQLKKPVSVIVHPPVREADPTPAAQPWPVETPLGDVARYYRKMKEPGDKPDGEERVQQAQEVAQEVEMPPRPLPTPGNGSTDLHSLKEKARVVEVGTNQRKPLPSGRRVRVRPGDSLWKLASRYLSNGNEWHKIAALNPELTDPNRIHVGQELRLPVESPPAVAKQVRVKQGDSLWKLAQGQWGEGQAWSCIVAANPQIKEADRIYPGQLLVFPPACSQVA